VLTRTGSEPANLVTARPDTVVALDPASNRPVDAFGVGRVPTQLATGGKDVWVFNSANGTVSRIEPSRRTVRTFSLGPTGFPRIGLALGSDSPWVALWTVYRIDLRSGAVRTVKLPERAGAGVVAAGLSDVWLIGGSRSSRRHRGSLRRPSRSRGTSIRERTT
jgi:streptogramin lyase